MLRPDLRKYSGASNLAFNERIKELKKSGEDIVHFGFGQSPFPVPDAMVQRLKEFATANDYLSVAGDQELREEICAFHKIMDGLDDLNPANLVVAPGSKSLIYLAMAVFGGTIWLPAPAWTTYQPQARLAGHTAKVIRQTQANEWKLTGQDLKTALEADGNTPLPEGESSEGKSTNLLVLTNPGNPSGCVYTRVELEQLAAVCRAYNVVVVSDEIYARLAFDNDHVSMAAVYPEGTVLTTGFSKWVGAGGWRMGYAHFPPTLDGLRQAVLSGASHTHSCAPAPMQFAVAKSLKHDMSSLEVYARRARTVLSWVATYCRDELLSVGVTSVPSRAGYYFMPDFAAIRGELAAKRGVTTGQDMCDLFLEEAGVALMPASSFLLEPEHLSVRFCFVEFDGGKCMEQLAVMEEENVANLTGPQKTAFVAEHCPRIVTGVQRLVNLVKKLQM